MPLGGGETAVAEDTGSHLHVIWVMHSDRGSNAIAEEVRVHWPTESASVRLAMLMPSVWGACGAKR